MKNGTVTLETKNLLLRRYTMEDAELLYRELGCNPVMHQYTGWNPYFSPEAAVNVVRETLEGYETNKQYSWMIEAEGKVVGIIGGYDYNEAENAMEVGYSVFRDNWGKGYASEVTERVCRYLMEEERIGCLKAWTASENIASQRVLLKAGFVQTEIQSNAIQVEDAFYDQVYFEKRSV